ncbi:hypothetical protein DK871_05420 [Pseudomonas sp. L13]|nr:hypothetical protein [Pseudomonas sp. L13]
MPVGASLLAKNPQAPRLSRKHALPLTFFASKLAPTGIRACPRWRYSLIRRHRRPASSPRFSSVADCCVVAGRSLAVVRVA